MSLGGGSAAMYLCHEVTALQAMLPAALKAKYERAIGVGEESGEQSLLDMSDLQEIVSFVKSKGSVSMDALMERFASDGALIKQLLSAGILTEVQVVKDRMNTKKALTVFPPVGGSVTGRGSGQLPARANKQQEVLRYLMEHPHADSAYGADGNGGGRCWHSQKLGGSRVD